MLWLGLLFPAKKLFICIPYPSWMECGTRLFEVESYKYVRLGTNIPEVSLAFPQCFKCFGLTLLKRYCQCVSGGGFLPTQELEIIIFHFNFNGVLNIWEKNDNLVLSSFSSAGMKFSSIHCHIGDETCLSIKFGSDGSHQPKETDFKPQSYANMENIMEVNPDKKKPVKPQPQLAVSIDSLVATPADKPDPSIIPCILLHCIHKNERRCRLGNAQPPYRGHISCINALSDLTSKGPNFNLTGY